MGLAWKRDGLVGLRTRGQQWGVDAGGLFTTAGGDVSAYFARWDSGFGFGDFDCDAAVNLMDFTEVESCMTGPGTTYAKGCVRGDHDGDQDLDLLDLQQFLNGFQPEP